MLVLEWSGYETRALRSALRLSQRRFAQRLGISARMVSYCESRLAGYRPQGAQQAALDAELRNAPSDVQEHFARLVADSPRVLIDGQASGSAQGDGLMACWGLARGEIGPSEVTKPASRNLGLQDEAATLVEPVGARDGAIDRVRLDELLAHWQDQWHLLVRTDNLLGPRHALRGVLDHLSMIDNLLSTVTTDGRRATVRIAAMYAESASWLYEDGGDLAQAQFWSSRALEWAHEAGDESMICWTLFRRSQQAAHDRNPAQVSSLAAAAGRVADRLPGPMRAAIVQQQAHGHALDGNDMAAQQPGRGTPVGRVG